MTARGRAEGGSPTADAVAQVLAARAGLSAAEVADAAGLGRSTAAKALVALEAAGLAVREPGGRDGGRRLPDRWGPAAGVATADMPVPAPENDDRRAATAGDRPGDRRLPGRWSSPALPALGAPARAEAVEPARFDAGGVGRLGRNQLRDLVLEALNAQAAQVGPTALARETGHSSGAIGNCLERLVGLRLAVRVGERPRRYQRAAEPTGPAAG